MIGADLLWLLDAATRELTLFAAIGLIVGGLDDLAIDLLWLARISWRRLTIYRRFVRADAGALPPPRHPGRIVLFVPAWDEGAVIGAMLRAALARFRHDDYRIYVGVYPNDPATIAAVGSIHDPRVRMVGGTRPGPTSKAECLNRLWTALLEDEVTEGIRAKAIVLHDAEDVVHPLELRVFDALTERFDMVQLPVLPLVDVHSRWVAGHYADEFAEAHGKQMVVREALGAGLPSAGVGCALARDALQRMADAAGGRPFDEDSLTEDYEIGLKIGAAGGRGAFVRIAGEGGRGLVAVRAYFPGTIDTAVRQKTRWLLGIALSGWNRLGWHDSLAENWMRMRDRRAILSAIVLAAAYAAMLLWTASVAWRFAIGEGFALPQGDPRLLATTSLLLVWRLAMRALMVRWFYGWWEGMRAVPRVIVGNAIAIMAARRALVRYIGGLRGAPTSWDKTTHHFPDALPAE